MPRVFKVGFDVVTDDSVTREDVELFLESLTIRGLDMFLTDISEVGSIDSEYNEPGKDNPY